MKLSVAEDAGSDVANAECRGFAQGYREYKLL